MDSATHIVDVELNDLECKHRIAIPGYKGSGKFVIVFMDNKANTYFWVTGSPGPFTDGDIYSIKAKLDKRYNRLSFVRTFTPSSESEQPDKPDAEDVLFGLAHY